MGSVSICYATTQKEPGSSRKIHVEVEISSSVSDNNPRKRQNPLPTACSMQ